MSLLKDIDQERFQADVLGSSGFLIVDFWAPWCAPCRAVIPILEELAEHYAGRVAFVKVNVDQAPKPAVSMGIRGVPTMVMLKDGREIDRIIGATCRSSLRNRIDGHLVEPNGNLAGPDKG